MKTETSVVMYCPICNDDREYRWEIRQETVPIRGKPITAQVPVYVCPVCGDTQSDRENDTMVVLYDAYRRETGMLSSADIKRIRERYGLSREAFAAVLGMSPATLYRYEGGSLQDELHDAMIFACEDSGTMERLVNRRKDVLSPLQLRRFEEAIQMLRAG